MTLAMLALAKPVAHPIKPNDSATPPNTIIEGRQGGMLARLRRAWDSRVALPTGNLRVLREQVLNETGGVLQDVRYVYDGGNRVLEIDFASNCSSLAIDKCQAFTAKSERKNSRYGAKAA